MAKHRTFKPEFKARIVLQVPSGAKIAVQVCRERQLSEQLLTSVSHYALKLVRIAEMLNGASQVADGNQL